MIGQTPFGSAHPVARVAEETVLNLKQLESRIEVLRNDLAQLCVAVGHPEAARIAATPVHLLGMTGTQGIPAQGFQPTQGITPFQSPWQGSPFQQGIGSVTPWQTPSYGFGNVGFGQFQNPYGYPYR